LLFVSASALKKICFCFLKRSSCVAQTLWFVLVLLLVVVSLLFVCVLHAKLNARLATLRHDVAARAAARAETDQARETNPDLTDFAKQSARRKVKGATLLLRHASSGGGAGGVVVTDPNAEVGRGEGREREGRGGVRVRGGAP
jgi:hypothetical protein